MGARQHSMGGESAIRSIVESAPEMRVGRRGRRRDEDGEGGTQRDRLLSLLDAVELWHCPDREAFATFPVKGHWENHAVRSRDFRLWLAGRYLDEFGGAAGGQAFEDALRVVEARAVHRGARHDVYLRIGQGEGRVYLDLADETWRSVEVSAEGWRVLERCPVKFRRSHGMHPLPAPEPGGMIEALRNFVNVEADADFRTVVAWLVGSLRPSGPYPILIVNGEQGSAKSTLCRLLRLLVDPNKAPIRAAPKDDRDLVLSARNSWALCIDNMSDVAGWLSDALCRLATGGGFATRELYSDDSEVIIDAQRPILINGIPDLAARPDLGDRALSLTLPAIPEGQRRPESELWRNFEAERPELLGALLDAVAAALRNSASVVIDHLPRMADFAHWVTAAEPGLGWEQGAFLGDYRASRERAVITAIESDPIALAVRELVDLNAWSGTATELLSALDGRVSEGVRRSRSWPRLPHQLSGRIRRLAPALRAVNVEIDTVRAGKDGARIITIRRVWKPGATGDRA